IRLYDLEQNEKALSDFEEARNLMPDGEYPVIAVGEYYRMAGRRADAVEHFQRAIQMSTNCAQAYLGLGLCAQDENQIEQADEFFNNAAISVLEEPDPLRALNCLRAPRTGRAYLRLGEQLRGPDPESALSAADKAIEFEILQGGQYPDRFAYRLKGEILLGLRKVEEAASSLREAGKRFAWEGESGPALECLEKAHDLDPNDREAAWQLVDGRYVVAYSKKGDEKQALVDSAVELWEQTIRKGLPEEEYYWVYLTRALLNEQRALLVPNNEWAKKVALFGQAIAF